MKKICFVVSDFPLLSETFVISQMLGLRARGFDVSVACDRVRPSNGIDPAAEPYRSLLAKTRPRWAMHRLLHAVIDRLPGRLHYAAQALADITFAYRLNRYDAILVHFGWNGSRLGRALRLGLLRRPVYTVFHGYDVALPHKQGNMRRYATLFARGAGQLPVSEYFRDLLLAAGSPPARTEVQRMGVDCDAIPFELRPPHEGPLRLISVARLVEKKGLDTALRALADLAARCPKLDWRYEIIGDGPLRASLEALNAALGLTARVRFLGPQPHSAVKARLREADLFLLPSVTAANGDMEGVPVALMEAMAAGLPVVSSFHSGIPELIEHNVSGRLAPERDAEGLSRVLEHAMTHPQEQAHMAVVARATVETRFNNRLLDDRLAAMLAEV